MVAFAIRSASATLPNIRPSAVHILNHLPGYAVTDRLPLIARAFLWPTVRIAQMFDIIQFVKSRSFISSYGTGSG